VGCLHENVICLNHYEFFRKYLCYDCGKVWMCECEKELALQFLPHQVRYGTESGTQMRYPVSGFAQNICPACRGQKEEAHPRAAIYGQKGKIERYYWREIYKSYLGNVRSWLSERNIVVRDIIDFENRFSKEAKQMRKEAKKIWQFRHKEEPKYDLKEPTEAAFLLTVDVPQKYLVSKYVQIRKGKQRIGKWIGQNGEPSSAEDVVKDWYENEGFSVRKCERKLISVLVGTLCASVIQDTKDPRVRIVMRQSTRGWAFKKRGTPLIQFLLPEDFGTKGYFKRRSKAFNNLLKSLEKTDLKASFEEMLNASKSLRDYLWVNDDEAVELGRIALRVMPQSLVLKCIGWAVRDFWNRQPGWPDLFVFRTNEFQFVEVKTPHDKLSLEQMSWFKWAIEKAAIPCEIFRLRKAVTADK
jgi:hypothetical protein